jgi:hypothetical protein
MKRQREHEKKEINDVFGVAKLSLMANNGKD